MSLFVRYEYRIFNMSNVYLIDVKVDLKDVWRLMVYCTEVAADDGTGFITPTSAGTCMYSGTEVAANSIMNLIWGAIKVFGASPGDYCIEIEWNGRAFEIRTDD